MAVKVTQVTKQVKKFVETVVDEPTGEVTISLTEPEYRRLGRILLGHGGVIPVYHGGKTDKFARDLAEAIGATEANSQAR